MLSRRPPALVSQSAARRYAPRLVELRTVNPRYKKVLVAVNWLRYKRHFVKSGDDLPPLHFSWNRR